MRLWLNVLFIASPILVNDFEVKLDLDFYGTVNTVKVMSSQSVNFSHLLGRFITLTRKWLMNLCTSVCQ